MKRKKRDYKQKKRRKGQSEKIRKEDLGGKIKKSKEEEREKSVMEKRISDMEMS